MGFFFNFFFSLAGDKNVVEGAEEARVLPG